MYIDLEGIGLLGVHCTTEDFEEIFIIQNYGIKQILIINMN